LVFEVELFFVFEFDLELGHFGVHEFGADLTVQDAFLELLFDDGFAGFRLLVAVENLLELCTFGCEVGVVDLEEVVEFLVFFEFGFELVGERLALLLYFEFCADFS
jgi:hypothetical protein